MRWTILALCVVAASAAPGHHVPRLVDRRIVGGVEAAKGEYPEQVSIRINGDHVCGGTLLHQGAVLTAAHCCVAAYAGDYVVVVGDHNINDQESEGTEQVALVYQIRTHENFDSDSLTNDICILIIYPDVYLTEYVAAARLARSDRAPTDQETLVATGWGQTSVVGDLSDTLQKVEVPYVPNDRCADYYGLDAITDGMLCAGKEYDGGVDTCQGDSGGPLFFEDHEQVGITSWGRGCARPRNPGVYTRTTYYNDWIAANSIGKQ